MKRSIRDLSLDVTTCGHFGKCGGCKLQNIKYKDQLQMKVDYISQIFHREPDEVIPSPKRYFYRNRMDYAVGPGYKVGLKERGKWWAYIDIKECLLQSEESNKIRNLFREHIKSNNITPWNTKKHVGVVRYLVIREGKFTNERLVHVVTSNDKSIKEYIVDFAENIINQGLATSVYWGFVNSITDKSFSDEYYLYIGKKYLRECLNDNIYYILPNSFFQPNSYTAKFMLKIVKDLIGNSNKVFELYSGIGTFSVEAGKIANYIEAIEINREAVELFKLNMNVNEIKNYKIINGKAESLDKISGDTVIIDPPRAGLHPKMYRLFTSKEIKKIIYISCNPKTQKRDLETLRKVGFKLEYISLIDQFPHTDHIETIILLKR